MAGSPETLHLLTDKTGMDRVRVAGAARLALAALGLLALMAALGLL